MRTRVSHRSRGGFTLIEMMITLAIFVLLAGAVFGLMTGVLQSANALETNQGHSDEIQALFSFVKNKLTMMPARSTIASYARGDGEGLIQNGIIFGNTNLATAIDGKIQPNGLYLLRLTTYATEAGGQNPQDARVVLTQAITTDDPTLSWTNLVKDVKTLQWKFQDAALVQWDDTWTSTTVPNLVEFTMQSAGDLQGITMDFWVPKINPISVHIQANPTSNGSGGVTAPTTPPRRQPPGGGSIPVRSQ